MPNSRSCSNILEFAFQWYSIMISVSLPVHKLVFDNEEREQVLVHLPSPITVSLRDFQTSTISMAFFANIRASSIHHRYDKHYL